jgi:DNA-binding response OmpR family regulator
MSHYLAPHITQGLRETVLVVDDEVGIRILLTRLLKGWGYRVRHVEDADAALQIMAAEPADILLNAWARWAVAGSAGPRGLAADRDRHEYGPR